MIDLVVLLAVGFGVFLLAGVAQSVSGFGLALVAVPLLALTVDPVTAVVCATGVGTALTGWAGVRERAHLDVPVARRLTVFGVIGMPVGLILLAQLDESGLEAIMAVSLVAALGLIWSRVQLPAGPGTARVAGVASGVLLTSTGMNGPPLVLGLNALRLPPRQFRATLQVVFCSQDVLSMVAFAVLGYVEPAALVIIAGGLLGSLLGWLLGDRVFHRINPEAFRRVLLVGLLVSAAVLVLSALTP